LQLSLAGDVAKMIQVKNVGTLLDEVYPDGSKVPDDFSRRVVEMPHQSVPVSIDLTIGNILSPLSKNEPKVVSLIAEIQVFSQSKKTQQMGLEEFVSRLETNLLSEEPAVTVSISRAKNPKSAEIRQDKELDISL
jgi:hypothetical protein